MSLLLSQATPPLVHCPLSLALTRGITTAVLPTVLQHQMWSSWIICVATEHVYPGVYSSIKKKALPDLHTPNSPASYPLSLCPFTATLLARGLAAQFAWVFPGKTSVSGRWGLLVTLLLGQVTCGQSPAVPVHLNPLQAFVTNPLTLSPTQTLHEPALVEGNSDFPIARSSR